MTTTIDFDALQVSEGPKVSLLGNQEVGGGLVGGDFADFSSFASLSVDAKVQRKAVRAPSPSLTVLVEHSDDGLSWSTAETFTFTDDGEQTAALASPKAHVRASASGSGAEWYVKSVNVAPISGGGGGSMPVTEAANYSGVNVTVSNAGAALDWQILDSGDDLIDVTDPLLPVVRKAGLFIVTAQVHPAAPITAGSPLSVDLIFDYTGVGAIISNTNFGDANGEVTVFVSGCYKLIAGQAMQLFANTSGGEPDRPVSLKNAFIARIGPA